MVRVERSGPVATVVINRPNLHNALDSAAWRALAAAADGIAVDPPRVALLRGEGPSFSSGSDLRELAHANRQTVEDAFLLMEQVIGRFERLVVPTIAVLRGYVLGSALVLACGCDLRVAVGKLYAGMPIGRLGIALGRPFLRRLNVLVGPACTKDLVFTGRMLSAREALRSGLVNYVLPEASLAGLATSVADMYPSVVRAAKASLMPRSTDERAYEITDEAAFREGLARFLSRRANPPAQ